MRAFILALLLGMAAAFQTPVTRTVTRNMAMSAESDSRRDFMVKAAGVAAAMAAPVTANALVDYAGVTGLGGGDQIDLNNANIRAYLRLPGMYPSIAAKICSNKEPFKSVGDVYNIKTLTAEEKSVIKEYEKQGRFTVFAPAAEYVIDRLNNGLYR